MGSVSVLLLLLIAQFAMKAYGAESSEEITKDFLKDLKVCPGGYCVKTYLCVNGTINTDGENIFQARIDDYDDNLVDVWVDPEDDPCEEFLLRCCSAGAGQQPTRNIAPPEIGNDFEPPPPSCGKNYPDGYIYRVKNSSVAQFAEFPWMASLLQRKELLDKETFEYLCGASLIHPRVVLTAAHCMRDHSDLEDIVVRLGEWDTVTENEPLAYQQYSVSKLIVHENFVDKKYHNDLALLILEDEADLNKHINPICLPNPNDSFDDMRCLVSGWGKENFKPEGKYSEVLKKVELPVLPREACKRIFKTTQLGPFFRLHSSFMCAGGEPGVDACKGDGGSPLACKTGESFVQAGIVAWGLGCGENGIPGAYVKVSNFVDWIKSALLQEEIVV